MRTRRGLAPLACLLTLALVAVACTSRGSSTSTNSSSVPAAAAGGPLHLKGVCPDPIVFQTDWNPESEHGFLYNLVGPGFTVDTAKKRVTGPLVASGKDTGVKIQVRMGGPSIGFQPVPAVMYLDRSITLGYVATEEAVQYSIKQPTTAVMAQLEISPLAIMWSPDLHPNFHTIADIGQTTTKVLYTNGLTYMEYLVGAGILRRAQLNGSYNGAPDLFVGSGGKAALQGFATSEPYLYEHEIKQWGKPLAYQLVNDTGYPSYFAAVSVRSGDKQQLAPCLRKLVPILQQSQVDFAKNPQPAINLILQLVDQYKTGWVYSRGLAEFSARQMVQKGIVANGVVGNHSDTTLGNFDMARVKRTMDIVTPIFAAEKKPVRPGLRPEDIATNEFIDPQIGLPS